MSPSGWPKGKPRGPRTGAAKAADVRARRRRKDQLHELASKKSLFNHTPALYASVYKDIPDYAYVNGYDLDECYLRALREGVVYVCTSDGHQEHALEELTITVLAAVERDARKHKRHLKVMPPPIPVAERKKVRKKVVPASRTGTPLLSVVGEMFSEETAGKPLIEVVSSLFDS